MDCAEESRCGFVVAGRDSSVMFELFEEVLDQVTSLVERLVIVALDFSVGFWRDHCLDFGGPKPVNHPLIGVIAFIRQQDIGFDLVDQNICTVQIAGLSGCQVKAQRIAQGIAKRVDFGTQPTL